MGLAESLEEFRDLHGRARAGALGLPDQASYRAARDKLAHLVLRAQHLSLLPGQRQRRVLRIARALQAEIEFDDGTVRAVTLQLSSGGFAALLANAPHVGEDVKVALRIPGGQPLHATARVVAVKEYLGSANTSFRFEPLASSDVERLESFVFDALMDELQEL
jgi:c-di-GMP-binding flagellar brake protein YcgR